MRLKNWYYSALRFMGAVMLKNAHVLDEACWVMHWLLNRSGIDRLAKLQVLKCHHKGFELLRCTKPLVCNFQTFSCASTDIEIEEGIGIKMRMRITSLKLKSERKIIFN